MSYQQIIKYPRVTILSEPAYDISINYQQPAPGVLMTFVHVDVYQSTPSVIREMLQRWPAVRARLPSIVFCTGNVDDAKFHRFVTLFGWHPLSSTPCSDGLTRRIYVSYFQGRTNG